MTILTIINNRYELQKTLGKGGMGIVYQALDLLSGKVVALKKVTVPTSYLAFVSRGEKIMPALALAQEFRALASLRHPHIISVFDFGFDRHQQPFYTMEYIDGGRNILEAGRSLPQEKQLLLIIQMLQALIYLHRHGILHRDLKPSNALMMAGEVKLLDFGLSVATGRTMEHVTQTRAGTMAYMAPELFEGAPYSKASDLYAVGVIAFELFTGEFPYSQNNIASMIHDILSKPVDTTAYSLDGDLAWVLNRLLAKSREGRYAEAADVIRDLCAAAGIPSPPESEQIRESFFQAARFIGRERELARLTELLKKTSKGYGHVVLVGGESGVGKSRLLDELRTQALVKGILVLRGQAVIDGRSPYELWREVLRTALLYSDLDADNVSLLSSLVPELKQTSAGRTRASLPLRQEEARRRLPGVVIDLLTRFDQPVVIILEDLQWAGPESIKLLADLVPAIINYPLLLTGSYREDTPLTLPSGLETVEKLHLNRFNREGIAQLSESMLGPAGRDPKVIDLLENETEGNAFFLVEAVRILSEETGQLGEIETLTLPESIMTGGMQAILERRLARVPGDAWPALRLASVASRVLDLKLMEVLVPGIDLEGWLTTCADVGVLEAYGETWRFSHDKLREALKDLLSHELHHELHRQVAEGMELLYADSPQHAAMMAFHWAVGGNPEKADHYRKIATIKR